MEELSHRINKAYFPDKVYDKVYDKVCEWLKAGEHIPIGLVFVVLVAPSDFLIS